MGNEEKIVVIGRNSSLYNAHREDLRRKYPRIQEYSHSDISNIPYESIAIVFSFDRTSLAANIKLIADVRSRITGRLIYISSTAVFARRFRVNYTYPLLKGAIEDYIISSVENASIIRVGVPVQLLNGKVPKGRCLLTSVEQFLNSIEKGIIGDSLIINSFSVNVIGPSVTDIYFKLYSRLGKYILLKQIFMVFDITLKLLGARNYGYTLLSNYSFESRPLTSVTIGGGLTANAVQSSSKYSDYRINPKSNIDVLKSPQSSTMLEHIGGGGNSDLWHGVISKLSNYKYSEVETDIFNKSLRDIYGFTQSEIDLLDNGYAFVPKSPLRPQIDNSMGELINDKVICINSSEGGFKIDTLNGEYQCESVKLAMGSLSLLKLLYSSGFLNKKCSFDDHMVGYFGQIIFRKKRKFNIIRNRTGHFKKYITIKLSTGDALNVTLRPAYGSFKDIDKASRYRSTFSTGAKNVILTLLKKISIPLIGEAIYNKYGYSIAVRTYNIVGHIETRNNVEFNKSHRNSIIYLKDVINLSDDDIDIIRKELIKFEPSSLQISKDVHVSPGLHFVNLDISLLDKVPAGIDIYSTLQLPSSVEHPTFTQFVRTKAL